MDTYYVYENWTHDRARIHKVVVGTAMMGAGHMSSPRNGRWSGPFDWGEAFKIAAKLNHKDTRGCPNCAP